MKTTTEGLERLRRDMLADAAPCKHILVPSEIHCRVCGERIRFDGPESLGIIGVIANIAIGVLIALALLPFCLYVALTDNGRKL